MIARFKREARTAAALTHPHIIPIYAVKETQDLIFFVMKYVRGRSLDAILREVGPLPFPMVRTILADIGSALDFAHRQGVVHRDVKPGNILVEEEGFAVITDFGIAKAAESESLTRSGTTVGTPSYLSPEACAGESGGPGGRPVLARHRRLRDDHRAAPVHRRVEPRDDVRPGPYSAAAQHRAASRLPARPARHDHADAREAAGGSVRQPQGSDAASSPWGQPPADEHVRSHIGLLAVPRAGRSAAEIRRTPSSPLSVGAVKPHCADLVDRNGGGSAGGASRIWAPGAWAFWRLQQPLRGIRTALRRPLLVVDSVTWHPDPADTLYLSARGAASYARQRAVAAGVTAGSAPGRFPAGPAESLATLGQKRGSGRPVDLGGLPSGRRRNSARPRTHYTRRARAVEGSVRPPPP